MLELRTARPDDPDALAMTAEVQRWYVEVYGAEDDEPLDVEGFAPPRGGFLVALLDGAAVGMGGWSRRGDGPADAKIRRMHVRPAGRRRGVATALLDALEADARAAGAARAVLATGEPQVAAVRFYRARGCTAAPPSGFCADVPTAVRLAETL